LIYFCRIYFHYLRAPARHNSWCPWVLKNVENLHICRFVQWLVIFLWCKKNENVNWYCNKCRSRLWHRLFLHQFSRVANVIICYNLDWYWGRHWLYTYMLGQTAFSMCFKQITFWIGLILSLRLVLTVLLLYDQYLLTMA
jgi:hypothetical protein